MAIERSFTPHRLVMGLLVSSPNMLKRVCNDLIDLYGPILAMSDVHQFTFTDYYDEEMGGSPFRCYLSFERLIDPSCLSSIKLRTNELERQYCIRQGREVNLDPGLLSLTNIILATTKNRAHRIPLMKGIYGELTLLYVHKSYQCFPWTYQDYASESVKNLFSCWREDYKKQLKQEGYL